MSLLLETINRLGLTLPDTPQSLGSYMPAKKVGDLIFTAGQLPTKNGEFLCKGTLPSNCSIEQAQEGARQCVLNAIAAARSVGEPRGVAKVTCFVASEDGFTDQPKVANGASDLLLELFGEAGRHARSAVGVPTLPAGVSVEIEFIFTT